MYYELYIDVFFLENFMLDSLLLMAVNRVMQYRNSYARMLAGGAAGSFLNLRCDSASAYAGDKNTSVWRWD